MLQLFRFYADSPNSIGLALASCVLGCWYMIFQSGGVAAVYQHAQLPDAQFGFSLKDIANLNCQNYLRANTWDLCVVIPTYTLAFGSLGIRTARRRNWGEHRVIWALIAAVADVIETCILRGLCFTGSTSDPSPLLVQLASLANQVKYTWGGLSIVLLLWGLYGPLPSNEAAPRVKKGNKRD